VFRSNQGRSGHAGPVVAGWPSAWLDAILDDEVKKAESQLAR
jgi:hypothetical protein